MKHEGTKLQASCKCSFMSTASEMTPKVKDYQ